MNIKHFTEILTTIFNNCLSISYFPKAWKTAVIYPISKVKFNPSNPNYIPETSEFRPISLTSNIGKILEDIILDKLWSEIADKDCLSSNQFGFRGGHSTTDALYLLRERIGRAINNKMSLVTCSLDLEKAFDSVWIPGLVYKIAELGFDSYLQGIIKSFLSDRSATINFNNEFSDYFPISRGVPQGTKLGPILYSIYINDMPLTENGVETLLYADDTIVMAEGPTPCKGAKIVDEHLKKVQRYYKEWGVKINEKKTNLLVFSANSKNKCRNNKRARITINKSTIKTKKEMKYLGVTFTENGKFDKHAIYAIGKAKKALAQTRFLLKNPKLELKYKVLIVDTFIWPTLAYGFPIWADMNKSKYNMIESLLNKCGRTITGLYRSNQLTVNEFNEVYRKWHSLDKVYKTAKLERSTCRLEKMLKAFVNRIKHHCNPRIIEETRIELQRGGDFKRITELQSILYDYII